MNCPKCDSPDVATAMLDGTYFRGDAVICQACKEVYVDRKGTTLAEAQAAGKARRKAQNMHRRYEGRGL